jgi:hypothetical protein
MNGVFLERSQMTVSFDVNWQRSVRTIVDTDFAKQSLKEWMEVLEEKGRTLYKVGETLVGDAQGRMAGGMLEAEKIIVSFPILDVSA